MHRITFLRHGESIGNIKGCIQGQVDFPLTDKGREQAAMLAELWRTDEVRYDLIISSTLLRARQTAETISAALGNPLEFDPIWQERSFGTLEGKQLSEVEGYEPPVDYFHPYNVIGDYGESQLDLYTRACQAVQGLVRRPAGRYLIVSHGAMLNKVFYAIIGLTPQGNYKSPIFRLGNTAYVNMTYDPIERQWSFLEFRNQVNTFYTKID
jgi:broad specificity phosphatase PhoE